MTEQFLLDFPSMNSGSGDLDTNIQAPSSVPLPANIVSLFSGAGGMDIGFKKAGFNTIWANEFDKKIAPSYQKYFPDTQFDGRSVLNIPNTDIPKNAIGIIGGPPCQSWSEAGARRGVDDPRGQLFYEYIRILKHIRPLFFVAENVHGLIHSRNRASFENILNLFKSEGYLVKWKLLTASDYGVAQDRQRVFIVGYHSSLGKSFQFPPPLPNKVTLADAIGDLKNIPPGSNTSVSNHEFIDSGYSPVFMSRNRVRDWHEASFTILATDRHIPFHPSAPKMIKIGTDKHGFLPGSEHLYRRLTVRECARIQSFPDDYTFIYSHIRNGYKMVGNAVPVELAFHIAKSIYADLYGKQG